MKSFDFHTMMSCGIFLHQSSCKSRFCIQSGGLSGHQKKTCSGNDQLNGRPPHYLSIIPTLSQNQCSIFDPAGLPFRSSRVSASGKGFFPFKDEMAGIILTGGWPKAQNTLSDRL
jgi:hypothetical protein